MRAYRIKCAGMLLIAGCSPARLYLVNCAIGRGFLYSELLAAIDLPTEQKVRTMVDYGFSMFIYIKNIGTVYATLKVPGRKSI